jgi:hypothetical protein
MTTTTIPVAPRPPAAVRPLSPRVAAPTVRECVRCTWRDFGATGLPQDFRAEYEDELRDAALEAIRRPLIEAWRAAGYRAVLGGPEHCVCEELSADDPDPEVWIAVRQRAVDLLDPDEVLAVAGLAGEYEAFRAREDGDH